MANLLNLFRKRKTPFIPLYNTIASEIEADKILNVSGDRFSKASKNNYKTMVYRFMAYEEVYGIIYLEDINPEWVEGLKIYLMEAEYCKNTISNTLAVLKAVLRRLHNRGIGTFNGSGISCVGETVTTVYNTIDELRQLLNLDLTETPGYERIRDIYVIHCFLGLRFGDLRILLRSIKTFLKREAGRTFIEIKTKKTGEVVVIPIAGVVKQLLEKHNYDLRGELLSSYYNASIKEVAKRAGLNSDVVFTRTEGGKRTDTVFKKYELMSSHTARRTFATNATLSGLGQNFIMKITGHRTVSAFERYIKCSNLDSAIKIADHAFFNIEMPATLMLAEKDQKILT